MEKQGYVSLWVGNCKSNKDLDNYVEILYTEDGDCIPSQFLNDFKIDMIEFNEDFIEVDCGESTKTELKEILEDFSYDNVIIPRFCDLNGTSVTQEINSVILLYNFKYCEAIKEVNNEKIEFKYLGTVQYK